MWPLPYSESELVSRVSVLPELFFFFFTLFSYRPLKRSRPNLSVGPILWWGFGVLWQLGAYLDGTHNKPQEVSDTDTQITWVLTMGFTVFKILLLLSFKSTHLDSGQDWFVEVKECQWTRVTIPVLPSLDFNRFFTRSTNVSSLLCRRWEFHGGQTSSNELGKFW